MIENKKTVLIITIGIMHNFLIPCIVDCATPAFLQKNAYPWSHSTLKKMSLRQKIGQLFVATIDDENVLAALKLGTCNGASVNDLITKYEVGGILFLGKSTIADQIERTNKYQQLSKIPLLVLQDLEWGLTMRLADGLRFPRNIVLGALHNESLIYDVAYEIGKQCAAIGVHINLAPVVDINNNAANPVIGTRSFSENPEKVARLGILCMKGLQDAGILACAKHFPGHGDTSNDSHYTLPTITHHKNRLEAIELYPFKQLINAGVSAIMPAHLHIPALDPYAVSTVSRPILTTLLKEKLNFQGLVISDALNMGALKDEQLGQLELEAFLAGNHLLLCSRDIPKAIHMIENAVKKRIVSLAELDARVLTILQAKENLGLMATPLIDSTKAIKATETNEAKQLKKQLYQHAITLVKNDKKILPIKNQKQSTCVIQIGGVSNSTFGQAFTVVKLPPLLVQPQISRNEIRQILKHCSKKTTIIVGLFDIHPSARMKNFNITKETLQLLTLLKKAKKNVILAIFGNPYTLSLFGKEDAIIMAYEDDNDAQEAAVNAILGKLKPQGKLPITASSAFSYGLGLSL
jgi:beta-glucosidase-like glycosyl hydrolase